MNFKLGLPLPALSIAPSNLTRSHLPLSKLPPRPCYAPLVKLWIDVPRRRANKIHLSYTAEQPQALVNQGKALWLLLPTAGRNPGWVVCSLKLTSEPECDAAMERALSCTKGSRKNINLNIQSHPKILCVCSLANAALKQILWGTKMTWWRNLNVTMGLKAPSHINISREILLEFSFNWRVSFFYNDHK